MREPSRRKMRTHIAVKRSDPNIARRRADHVLQTRLHLAGGLVREGYGENAVRSDAQFSKQVGNTVRQNARLSAAGPSEDQNRAIGLPNGGRLHVVENFGFEEHLWQFAARRVDALFTALLRLQQD